MKTQKTDEELWQEALSVFEDNREAVKPSPQEVREISQSESRAVSVLRRIAAAAVVVFLIGGLAWAAMRFTFPHPSLRSVSRDTIATTQADSKAAPTDSTLLFADARLDSLLTVVARHYGRTLCIQGEDVAKLRILTKWYVSRPLSAFVESMNEFDGLRLTDERDTLFVTIDDELKEEEARP